jgi:hypothetical protein
MGNRKLPFGYKMELGEVVILPAEAGLVQLLFQQYIRGSSYLELVNALREQDIPYDTDKLWNKNMVARILEDTRYTGQNNYPRIIQSELLQCACAKRAAKKRPSQKTEAQKVLRKLCSGNLTKQQENHVLAQLNFLIDNPHIVHTSPPSPAQECSMAELKKRLDSALTEQPIAENAARHLIMTLAAEQYNQLGGAEYETERINRLLSKAEHMTELDADLLRAVVSEVKTDSNGVINIRLKNGQILGGEGR